MEWSQLIEQLEKDGISPEEANKRIRGYDMIKSIIDTVEKLERTKEYASFLFYAKGNIFCIIEI